MKIRFNDDPKVVATIREGLRRKDGYCPCRQGKGKRAPEAYGTHFSCPGASYRRAGRAVRAARIPATDSAGT